MADILALNE